MTFLKEARDLSKNYKSEKIEKIKKLILKKASEGEFTINIIENFYDRNTINWLNSQGFSVKETDDPRDGNFITIDWKI